MKEAEIQVASSIDTTLPDPGDPTYQMECLSLELRQTLKDLKDNSFVFQAAEASDFSAYGNSIKTFIDNMRDREDDILVDGVSSVVATLPDVVPIIAAILSGGSAAVPSILLNAVMGQLYRSRNSAITAREGEIVSDLDASELTAAIEDINLTLADVQAELAVIKRGLVIPANGASAEYFVDLFKAFGLEEDMISKLEAFLDTININLFQEWGTQRLSWGPPPVEE